MAPHLLACRGCLSTNRKLYFINSLGLSQSFTTLLAGSSTVNNVIDLQYLCTFCLTLLKKYNNFRETCLRSQILLNQLEVDVAQVTTGVIASVDRDFYKLDLDLVTAEINIVNCDDDDEDNEILAVEEEEDEEKKLEQTEIAPEVEDIVYLETEYLENDEEHTETIKEEQVKLKVEMIEGDELNEVQEDSLYENVVTQITVPENATILNRQLADEDVITPFKKHTNSDDFAKITKIKLPIKETDQITENVSVKKVSFAADVNVKKISYTNVKKLMKEAANVNLNKDIITIEDYVQATAKTQLATKKVANKAATATTNEMKQMFKRKVDNDLNFSSKYSMKVFKLTRIQQLEEFNRRRDAPKYLESSFQCTDCFIGFSCPEKLNSHILSVHDVRIGMFVCEFCKIRFEKLDQLSNHMDTHRYKFKCKLCDFFSRNRSNAMRHSYDHQTAFACAHCDQKFQNKTPFLRHLRKFHTFEAFCNICGEQFNDNRSWVLHRKICNADIKTLEFTCTNCGVCFLNKKALDVHTIQGCSEKACLHCGVGFKSNKELLEHLQRKQQKACGKSADGSVELEETEPMETDAPEYLSQYEQEAAESIKHMIEQKHRDMDVVIETEEYEACEADVEETVSENVETLESENSVEFLNREEIQAAESIKHILKQKDSSLKLKCLKDLIKNNSEFSDIDSLVNDNVVDLITLEDNAKNPAMNEVDDISILSCIDEQEFTRNYNMTVSKQTKEEQLLEMINRRFSPNMLVSKFRCKECFKSFNSEEKLENHIKLSHDPELGDNVCPYCAVRFKTKWALSGHLVNHKYKFTCNVCDFTTKRKKAAQIHSTVHSVPNVYKDKSNKKDEPGTDKLECNTWCDLCGKTFSSKWGMHFHKSRMHVELLAGSTYSCVKCGKAFITDEALKVHNSEKCSEQPCLHCGVGFSNVFLLLRHLWEFHRKNSLSKSVDCETCGTSFRSARAMARHSKLSNGVCIGLSPCDMCGVNFDTPELLKQHKLETHVEKKYRCDECGRSYTTAFNFGLHYDNVHVKKPRKPRKYREPRNEAKIWGVAAADGTPIDIGVTSDDGNTIIPETSEFIPDLGVNVADITSDFIETEDMTGLKVNITQITQKGEGNVVYEGNTEVELPNTTFGTEQDSIGMVYNIQQTCSIAEARERRYSCQYCGKLCKNSVLLKYHVRTHTGEKPHQCPTCLKFFRVPLLLQTHMRVHTGERPHSCDFCSKAFKSRTALSRHRLVHTGQRLHVCEICYKSFKTSTDVKTHIKTVHMKIPGPKRIRPSRTKKKLLEYQESVE